jgi:hypothetical protein
MRRLISGWNDSAVLPVRVEPESSLFVTAGLQEAGVEAHWDGYALQMMLKLLVAQTVHTDFYVTLDADVMLLRGFAFEHLVRDGRGLYHPEPYVNACELYSLHMHINTQETFAAPAMVERIRVSPRLYTSFTRITRIWSYPRSNQPIWYIIYNIGWMHVHASLRFRSGCAVLH